MRAACRYACPVVDMPALLSIHPLPVDTRVLAVVVVGRGAADDVAGSVDAHIPQGGEGQGMAVTWG